jgi:ABC-2 type transport system permease protein
MVPLAFQTMYQSEENMQNMAATLQNPVMVAMIGPASAEPENYTIGAMNAHQMLVFVAIAIALMNIFLVIRHTRRDEELGRQEVIRSLPVGHSSMLSATLAVAVIINIVIGLSIALGLTALGIESIDFAGSILYGTSIAIIGIVFAGIAAIAAQLSQTARGAIGLSIIILIASYLLRAIGDMNLEVLSLISPLGLVLRTEAAVNNNWWPILVLGIIAIILFIKAFWLNSIRDMDQSFIPAKLGRARASKLLVKPTGLSLRLMRGTIIAWTIGLVLLGASYGSILGDTEAFADTIAQMTGGLTEGEDIAKAFVSVLMLIIALFSCVPCLIMTLKLRSEEKRGRIEMILAGAVSRTKIFLSYVIPSLIFSFIAVFVSVLGLWGAGVATMETPIPLADMLQAAFIFIPAIWMTIGLATLLIGLSPKKSGWVWAFLTYSFLVLYLGNMINIPEWMGKLTPFGHVSQAMVENIDVAPLIITSVLAIVLLVAGFFTYKHREMKP